MSSVTTRIWIVARYIMILSLIAETVICFTMSCPWILFVESNAGSIDPAESTYKQVLSFDAMKLRPTVLHNSLEESE